jgi:hypothetical protein
MTPDEALTAVVTALGYTKDDRSIVGNGVDLRLTWADGEPGFFIITQSKADGSDPREFGPCPTAYLERLLFCTCWDAKFPVG